MNSITLTAEQAAQVRAGVREFVIEGELIPGECPFHTYKRPGCRTCIDYRPPKQWADADGQRVELRVEAEAGRWPQCDYPNGVLVARTAGEVKPHDNGRDFVAVLTDVELADAPAPAPVR